MQRKGKIARLPFALRTELNRRLAANEDGGALLDWLNASPDVQAILARDFAGEPISKQNLYEWRHGGFAESQTRQELLEHAGESSAEAAEFDPAASGHLIGHLVALLAVRYAALLARWDRGDNEALRVQLRALHTFTRDLAALHRINQFAERQQRDQARSNRKAKQHAATATEARNHSAAGGRGYNEHWAPPRREAEAASMPVAMATALSTAPSAAMSVAAPSPAPAPAAARTPAAPSVIINPESPQSDRIGLISRNELPNRGSVGSNQVKPNASPLPPPSPNWPVSSAQRAAFGQATLVKPMLGRGLANTKNEVSTIPTEEPPLPSASALDSHSHIPSSRGSTSESSLHTAAPVLISPENAVDRLVAACTPPPASGLLPAALRREIVAALSAPK
jgi:hypothetical protein